MKLEMEAQIANMTVMQEKITVYQTKIGQLEPASVSTSGTGVQAMPPSSGGGGDGDADSPSFGSLG